MLGLLLADSALTVGRGKTFWRVGLVSFIFKGTVTWKRKVEKSIPRCEMDRLSEGYKWAVDKIWDHIAKNWFLGRNPKIQKCATETQTRVYGNSHFTSMNLIGVCCGLPCASSRFLLDWMISGILNCCASCLHSWQAYAFQFALVCQGSETLSTVAFVVLYDLTLFPCSAKIIKIWFGTFTCTKFMLNSQLIFSISFIDVSSTDGAAVTCNWFDPESTRT